MIFEHFLNPDFASEQALRAAGAAARSCSARASCALNEAKRQGRIRFDKSLIICSKAYIRLDSPCQLRACISQATRLIVHWREGSVPCSVGLQRRLRDYVPRALNACHWVAPSPSSNVLLHTRGGQLCTSECTASVQLRSCLCLQQHCIQCCSTPIALHIMMLLSADCTLLSRPDACCEASAATSVTGDGWAVTEALVRLCKHVGPLMNNAGPHASTAASAAKRAGKQVSCCYAGTATPSMLSIGTSAVACKKQTSSDPGRWDIHVAADMTVRSRNLNTRADSVEDAGDKQACRLSDDKPAVQTQRSR
jgi:hypothetical protein